MTSYNIKLFKSFIYIFQLKIKVAIENCNFPTYRINYINIRKPYNTDLLLTIQYN